MSGTQEAILKAIDITLLIIMADKVSAARQREIARIVNEVQAGNLTVKEGQKAARFKDGDALDQALGNEPPPA